MNLEWQERLPETYISIFRRLKELFSLHFTDLTFANFEGKAINMQRVGINVADKINADKRG
jgi:hypothetical protein